MLINHSKLSSSLRQIVEAKATMLAGLLVTVARTVSAKGRSIL
jgi:hypothetical protein